MPIATPHIYHLKICGGGGISNSCFDISMLYNDIQYPITGGPLKKMCVFYEVQKHLVIHVKDTHFGAATGPTILLKLHKIAW